MVVPQRIGPAGCEASRRVRRSLFVTCSTGIAVFVGILWYNVNLARQDALHSACRSPLGTLHLALWNYHDVHGHFPPAYLVNEDGTPIHSWRVLVLPYMDEQQLYDEYSFDEPWNGPNNIHLAHKMPTSYHCPSERESDSMTNYAVIVGKDTVFPFDVPTSSRDVRDGRTILVAEIADSDILWTEPRDLAAATMSFSINHASLPSISSARHRGPLVTTTGRRPTYTLSQDLDPETLRAFSTIAAGDEISMVKFQDTGFESFGNSVATDQTLRDLSCWNQVQGLWLNHSSVTDAGIRCLRGATRLSSLDLSSTEVTDEALEHLKELPELYSVNLRGTQVSPRGVLDLLKSSEYLQIVFSEGWISNVENPHGVQLELSGPSITGEQLRRFGIVRAPAYVDLDGVALTDEFLMNLVAGFVDLRRLRISNTQVTDAGLKQLAEFGSLRGLYFQDIQGVSDEGINRLQQALPNCKVTSNYRVLR